MEQQSQSTGGAIVVMAVDDSKHSEYAFQYYANDVHRPGNTLHVIHCAEGSMHVHPMDGGPSPAHAQELNAKNEQAQKALKEKFTKMMQDNQINGEVQMVLSHHKNAWHDIVSYQEKVGGVMIVIGSRGLGALRRTMMGSVSDSVVHHASCPVLVCRHS